MAWLIPIKAYGPLVLVVLIFIAQGVRLLRRIRSSGVSTDTLMALSLNYTVALIAGVFVAGGGIVLSKRYDIGHTIYYVVMGTILLVQTHVEALSLMMNDKP